MSEATDYLPPDGMTLDVAGEALAHRLQALDGAGRESDRTFFDTFDCLLRDAGLSLVHEDGQLRLLERGTGLARAWLVAPLPGAPVFAEELEPGPLREVLLPVVHPRALLPLVHVHSRQRALAVRDEERKAVVRMTLEEPALVMSSGRHAPLRPRLRVDGVRGYDRALRRIREAVEHDLGFRRADQPLVDEAVRAAGAAPAGISSRVHVPLEFDERADRAAAAVLRALLDVIEANLAGTIADTDSEFLHDLRVSVRRSRAVQRELKHVFPAAELAHFRGEFKWLQAITGDSRDLDVYVRDFEPMRQIVPESMRADLDPLLGVLRRRRLIARREMVRALRSERGASLLPAWASFLDGLVGTAPEERPDCARPIGEVAGERISKVYKRMIKMGSAINASCPPQDYHELRKKGKELRYLLELFGVPTHPAEVVKPMVKTLKALQDVLGRHQDREVQVALLRSLRDEVSALPGGPGALMAMGVLVQRLGDDERAARAEFAESFQAFASREQRTLVRDTFT